MTKGPGGELTFSMADMEAESQAYQIVLAEWKAADATRHKRHGVDRSYALQARATDDLTAAERLVFGTPAPSLSAIADKVRLARESESADEDWVDHVLADLERFAKA